MKKKAAFFDRDDTLIRDVHYLSSLDQVEIIPGVIDLCLQLQSEGYLLFVVTNQSGVARGYFDELFVEKTHKYLDEVFKESGVVFQQWYCCPHHPEHGDRVVCDCRKPKSGMLLKAARDYEVDLGSSIMIGDKDFDIKAGEAAGCRGFYIQEMLENSNKRKK